MQYTWILWDFFVVLLLIILVHRSAERGFARSLISLFSFVIASVAARFFSEPLAVAVYDRFVEERLVGRIAEKLDSAIAQGNLSLSGNLLGIPESMQRVLQKSGQGMLETLFGGDTAAMAKALVQQTLQEPALAILEGLLFLILFAIAICLLRRVSRLFSGLYRIPILGTINTLLGGIVGIGKAMVFLVLIGMLLRALVAFSGGEWALLNEEVFQSTYMFRYFYKFG